VAGYFVDDPEDAMGFDPVLDGQRTQVAVPRNQNASFMQVR